MPTMNVSLTAKMVEFVEAEISGGDYATASEVVRDALRLLEHERVVERNKLVALRSAIDVGWRQADRGDYAEIDVAAATTAILRDGV